MCWFHMKKCVKDHLRNKDWAIDKVTRNRILVDVGQLQLCWGKEFGPAAQLFKAKWIEQGHDKFVRYFAANWLDKNANWYEGASPGSPSTNNAVESFNSIIKKKATLRKTLPLSRFLNLIQGKIEMWSKEMSYVAQPTISQKTWLAAYNLVKEKRLMEETRVGDRSHLFCPLKGKMLSKSCIVSFNRRDWKTFDEFSSAAQKFHFITFINSRDDWRDSVCSCRVFQKTYVCKHVVGVAIIRKYVKVPYAIKAIPIGGKVGPGRKPNAKKAWRRN